MKLNKNILEYSACVHGGRIIEFAEKTNKKTDELIDFSVSLNPIEYPNLKEIFINSYNSINKYPDNRYLSFKKAVAEYLNISEDNIIVGNGSIELIRLFAETVIQKDDIVIIPYPTFGEYESQCKLFGAKIEYIDYDKITEFEPSDSKAVFLCNPNNPTGKLLSKEKVISIAKKCISNNTYFVVDEAFIELSDKKESIIDFAISNDYVFVLRSLTKSHAVPGLRIGFGVASSSFAEILNKVKLPWSLNSIGFEIGKAMLKNSDKYLKVSLEYIKKEKDWLYSKLKAIRGLKPYKTDANFMLIDLNDFLMSSTELTERLLKYGIIVRDCGSFCLDSHIRIGVKKRDENKKLIEAIMKVISDWGNEQAKQNLDKALKSGVTTRSRIDCEYYPCHFKGQDCTFCFCPFYPCENEKTGGEYLKRQTGDIIWNCTNCHLIHKSEVAETVLNELIKGTKIDEIWKIVIEKYI